LRAGTMTERSIADLPFPGFPVQQVTPADFIIESGIMGRPAHG
jgi:hypothetical protein